MSNLNFVFINRFSYSRDSCENQKNSIFYEACTQSLLTLMERKNPRKNFYLDYNFMKKHLTSFLLQRYHKVHICRTLCLSPKIRQRETRAFLSKIDNTTLKE